MSANHPLIGHAVRVNPGLPPRIADRSFDGVVMDLLPEGILLVMRLDDGTVKTWGPEAVTFSDPERAARVLRAHAATTEAQGLGFKVESEYTPPRWVPAKNVPVGASCIVIRWAAGAYCAHRPDVPLSADDLLVYRKDNPLMLIGEWPPLPKETT